jgi:hypothetical protein
VGGAVTLCGGGGSDISDSNHDTRGGGGVSSEGGGREGGGESRSGGGGVAERTCSDSMAERLEAFVRTHVCASAADLFLGAYVSIRQHTLAAHLDACVCHTSTLVASVRNGCCAWCVLASFTSTNVQILTQKPHLVGGAEVLDAAAVARVVRSVFGALPAQPPGVRI